MAASACSYTGTDCLDTGPFPEITVKTSAPGKAQRNTETFHGKQIVFADLDRKILC